MPGVVWRDSVQISVLSRRCDPGTELKSALVRRVGSGGILVSNLKLVSPLGVGL